MKEFNPRCPRCGLFMSYYITYANGLPYDGYRCNCGYDTANQKIIYSNKTNIENEDGV